MHRGLVNNNLPEGYEFVPFTRAEEYELFYRYRHESDSEAGEQLCLSVALIIRKLTKKSVPHGLFGEMAEDYAEDLFNHCFGWLVKSLNAFDPESGFRFSTYVYRATQNHIRNFANQKKKERLLRTNCPDILTQSNTSRNFRLQCQKHDNTETKIAINEVVVSDYHKVDRRVDSEVLNQLLDKDMDILQPRTREAFRMRYIDGKSNRQIAAHFGVSKGRIDQILEAGKQKMRETPGAIKYMQSLPH